MGRSEARAWELTAEDSVLFHDQKGRPLEAPCPLAPLVDTHGHLTAFWQAEPVEALVRAAQAGVCRLVVPLDPTDDAQDARGLLLDLAGWLDDAGRTIAGMRGSWDFPSFPAHDIAAADLPREVRIVAGAHPYGAADFLERPEAHDAFLRLAESPLCVGIGEIGLDYTCDVPKEAQHEAFARQLAYARDRRLPVELHIRDAQDDPEALAHRDALEILRREGVPEAGCDLHCYTSGRAVLAPYLELGCSVAFGGAVTFRKSDDIRDAALSAPADRLLSETDCPYMAPVPLRGLECEPAQVRYTAAFLAQLRFEAGAASSLAETYEALWRNASDLFWRA